jgi:hypothetical protein
VKETKPAKPGWGLLRRCECQVPTRKGWVVLTLVCLALLFLALKTLHPFLAPTDPVPGGLLVAEGWLPDYGLAVVAAEVKKNRYDKIYVTGGPRESGDYLVDHKTFAELGAATLVKMGLNSEAVQAVPAPAVRQDRTYASALALKEWLRQHGIQARRLYVISSGCHARRTRLLYQKAMDPDATIGIMAIESIDYDSKRWWASSHGFRNVTGELIAYAYARLFFWPSRDKASLSATNAASPR